jgi:hypothetical protein
MTKTPIMPPDQERFMAFEGLVQWTEAVVTQSARVSQARDRLQSPTLGLRDTPQQRLEATKQLHKAIHAFHTECHFFAIAAHKLLEYRDWVRHRLARLAAKFGPEISLRDPPNRFSYDCMWRRSARQKGQTRLRRLSAGP